MLVIGAIGLLVSDQFNLPGGTQLCTFLIGSGLVLAGGEALYSREMSLLFSSDSAPGHAGIPAVVWGLMLVSGGAAIIGYGFLNDIGQWAQVRAMLRQNPGWLYMAAGMQLIGCSILLYVDSGSTRSWVKTLVLRVPRVFFALVLLLAGIAGTAGGTWQLLDPQKFIAFQRDTLSKLDKTLDGFPAQPWFKK